MGMFIPSTRSIALMPASVANAAAPAGRAAVQKTGRPAGR